MVAREAIREKPNDAESHHSLGVLLNPWHGLLVGREEAMAHLLIARRLRPNDASISSDLRNAIIHSTELRSANPLDPREPHGATALDDLPRELANVQPGKLLNNPNIKRPRSDLDSVRAARKNFEAMARSTGLAKTPGAPGIGSQFGFGRLSLIEEELRSPGGELARVLRRTSGHDIYGHRARSGDGVAGLRDEIRRLPEDAEPHAELGAEMMSEGQLEEAIAEFRRALDLEPPETPLAVEVARRLAGAERHALLGERLPRVLRGEEQPDGGDDWLSFAEFASGRQLYTAAVRLYEGAAAAAPELFDPRHRDHRYQAACAAAQAGSGIGRDQPAPAEVERARLRARAREWLRADLAIWSEAVAGDGLAERIQAVETLRRWKSTPDLAGIRDEPQLSKLPLSEWNDLRALWSEVDALLGKAGVQRQGP